MKQTTFVLTYDEAPPSSNKNNGVGGRGHPIAVSRTKKKWSEVWSVELMRVRVPRNCKHVYARFLVEYATRHRRDSDNVIFPLSKPFGDSLVHLRIIPDDIPEFYSWDRPEIRTGVQGLSPLSRSRTTITLTCDE